jgi:tetratricopeptide (TPR) repeat protein
LVIFAALTAAIALFAGNLLIEQLERRALLDTLAEGVVVQSVLEAVYERDGDRYVTSRYGLDTVMPPQSFAADKGERWRLFVTGGSFAMGSPYTAYGDDLWAGIPAYLQASLAASSDRPIEVVNAAVGGQDSSRVAGLVPTLLEHAPDALLVASCNNEAAMAPSAVETALMSQGGYRLLRRLLHRRGERAWSFQPDPSSDELRLQFGRNLTSVVQAAREAGVRVYLATLPINLGYDSFQLGHSRDSYPDPRYDELLRKLGTPVRAAPADWTINACYVGLFLSDAGLHDDALPWLQRCLRSEERSEEPQMARGAGFRLAYSFLARGEKQRAAREVLAQRFAPCTVDGIAAYAAGDHAGAVAALADCDEDLAEGLRWTGLAERALGRERAARALLRQAAELTPRNRCRPSYNDLLRAVAEEHEHVVLVDLERSFEELSEARPDEDWFLDYCHMGWRGYAEMGRTAFEAVRAHEVGLVRPGASPLPTEEFGALAGVPDGGVLEQWRYILHRGDYPAAAR